MVKFGEKPFLECSSKGDKRFSAFYAKINGKSIEDIYQAAKIFEDGSTGLSAKAAKGKKAVNMNDVRDLYSELWKQYLDENPKLHETISEYKGFSDIFGQKNCACQAEEVLLYKQSMSSMNSVEIYTDGACRGNPGDGGWGVHLTFGPHKKELSGGELNTTNNRMELTAVIKGLQSLRRPCDVKIYSDSKYVLDGISTHISKWKKNNWRTAAKKPVKNVDLWKELDLALDKHNIQWLWVKGHSGDIGNDLADNLANKGIDDMLSDTHSNQPN